VENNIILNLRDDTKYYGEYGSAWFSNSDIKTLLTDPTAWGAPKGFEIPLEQGKIFHWALYEPEKLAEVTYSKYASRNAKAYKEEVEILGVEGIILKKEVDEAVSWADAIKANDHFKSIIDTEGSQIELPGVGQVMGYPFKGKMDQKLPTVGYDSKSTANIDDFKWNAKKYGYDSQAYIYEQVFHVPLIFLVVCKKTKRLGKYYPTADFIAGGKDKVKKALQVYEKFYGSNKTEDIKQYFLTEEL
jgi:hypothetical protein